MTSSFDDWLLKDCSLEVGAQLKDLQQLFAMLIQPPHVFYSKSQFVVTKRANKVSKESVLCGSDHIGVSGRTLIENNVTIRGDINTVEIGLHCLLSSGSLIHPSQSEIDGKIRSIPMELGDYVIIGPNSKIFSAKINNYVYIGSNCLLGERSIISSCSIILNNSIITDGTVIPPFSIYRGNPAKLIGRVPPSFQSVLTDYLRDYYRHFQTPMPNSNYYNINPPTIIPSYPPLLSNTDGDNLLIENYYSSTSMPEDIGDINIDIDDNIDNNNEQSNNDNNNNNKSNTSSSSS